MRLGLVGWYAYRDAFNRRALWRFTLPLLLTQMFLVGGVLAGVGLTRGASAVRKAEFARKPFALWVGSGKVVGEQITPARLDMLRAELTKRLPGDPPRGRVFPYYEVSGFFFATGDGPAFRSLDGRTVLPGDPTLERLSYSAETPGRLTTDGQPGLLVAKSFLVDFLKIPASPPPSKLRVQMPSGMVTEVPIVAITEELISPGFAFALTPGYEADLLAAHQNAPSSWFESGPVPEGFPRPETLAREVREPLVELYDGHEVLYPRAELDFIDGVTRWRWEAKFGKRPTQSSWRLTLRTTDEVLTRRNLWPSEDARQAFLDPKQARFQAPEAPPKPRVGYDAAGAWVNDPDDLREAFAACKVANFSPPDELLAEYETINEQAKEGDRRLWWAIGGGGLLGLVMLLLIQRLHAQQKRMEFGLLKAMGFGPWPLLSVCLVQATVLWLIGTAGGIAAGYAVGGVLAGAQAPPGMPPGLGFAAPAALAVLVAAGAGLASLVSAGLSTYGARKKPASESLGDR